MSKLNFIGDAVYSEKYTDKTTGEEKTKYTNVGAFFEREDGSICVKHLNSWINCYPKKYTAAPAERPDEGDGFTDDSGIPF